VDVGPEDRQLEQPSLASDRGVRRVVRIRGDRAEHRHPEVDRQHQHGQGRDRRATAGGEPQVTSCNLLDPERRERRDRQARDRQQALGYARCVEAGDDTPDRLVAPQVRAERKQRRNERGEPEEDREPALPA
jgi:hypothetical protein